MWCGYCRRCAIHDDPGGCLTVEQWEREHPEEAREARIQALIAWGCTPYEARIRAEGEGF